MTIDLDELRAWRDELHREIAGEPWAQMGPTIDKRRLALPLKWSEQYAAI